MATSDASVLAPSEPESWEGAGINLKRFLDLTAQGARFRALCEPQGQAVDNFGEKRVKTSDLRGFFSDHSRPCDAANSKCSYISMYYTQMPHEPAHSFRMLQGNESCV